MRQLRQGHFEDDRPPDLCFERGRVASGEANCWKPPTLAAPVQRRPEHTSERATSYLIIAASYVFERERKHSLYRYMSSRVRCSDSRRSSSTLRGAHGKTIVIQSSHDIQRKSWHNWSHPPRHPCRNPEVDPPDEVARSALTARPEHGAHRSNGRLMAPDLSRWDLKSSMRVCWRQRSDRSRRSPDQNDTSWLMIGVWAGRKVHVGRGSERFGIISAGAFGGSFTSRLSC